MGPLCIVGIDCVARAPADFAEKRFVCNLVLWVYIPGLAQPHAFLLEEQVGVQTGQGLLASVSGIGHQANETEAYSSLIAPC